MKCMMEGTENNLGFRLELKWVPLPSDFGESTTNVAKELRWKMHAVEKKMYSQNVSHLIFM